MRFVSGCFKIFLTLIILNTIYFIRNTQIFAAGQTVTDTKINLTVGLDGLGNAGDSLNRNGGNKNPAHKTRSVTISVLNSVNQTVAQENGIMSFQSLSGLFTGIIDLGNQITTGTYSLKISSPGFLTLNIPQTVNLKAGSTIAVGTIYLVNGNINNDTQLDITDYNVLVGCYLSQVSTTSCLAPITASSSGADINDDGVVDEFDYNLFVRELSTQ